MRLGARLGVSGAFAGAMLLLLLAATYSRGTQVFWARESGSAVDWLTGAAPLVAACVAGFCCYVAQGALPVTSAREAMCAARGWRLYAFAAGGDNGLHSQ